jgi:hypothetical protein
MEAEALVSAPVILVAALLAVVAGLLGFGLGRSREEARKHAALKDAESANQALVSALKQENRDKLDVLAKASANELAQLREQQLRQVDRINQEHNALVERLDAGHAAALRELEAQRQAELLQSRQDRADAEAALREQHREAVAGLTAQRGRDQAEIETLEQTLSELREEIKAARMNNMFSMSRSGEKLIRVVRSVQELATELDETSRTVTGGDYSFFEQIKDQRDRDTVRRLTGAEAWTLDQDPAAVDTPADAAGRASPADSGAVGIDSGRVEGR